MKICNYLLCAAAVLLGSCSVMRNRTYAPDTTQLNISMGDMEYLGETQISVDYRTYLGFISAIDDINGTAYDGKQTRTARLEGRNFCGTKVYPKLNRATFGVLEKYPDANYFIIVSQTKEKTRLFLGAKVTVKATVKAYSFKK